MISVKKAGAYLLLVVLLAGFACVCCGALIGECVDVLHDGTGGPAYLMAETGSGGELAVLGVDHGNLVVIRSDNSGKRTARVELDMKVLPEHWQTAAFYPDGQDACFLGLYDLDAASLKLYHVDEEKTVLMLEEACSGTTSAERMSSVRFGGFSRIDGLVSFALLEGSSAAVYTTLEDGSGLLQTETYRCPGAQAACVLDDGRLLIAAGEALVFPETGETYTQDNRIISDFRQVGVGIYMLDHAGLEVFYADLTSPDRFQSVMQLERRDYDLNGVTDWSITAEGKLLLLLSDGRLVLDKGNTVQDLSGALYRSRTNCLLILIGLALAVLFAAFVIWLIVCQWMGMRLSLLTRWGAVLLALVVLGVLGLQKLVLQPAIENRAAAAACELAGSVTALALDAADETDPAFGSLLAGSLESAGIGQVRDAVVSVYEKDENSLWRLLHGSFGAAPGTRAELTKDFDRELALQAQKQGSAAGETTRDGQTRYCCYRIHNGSLIVVSVGAEGYLAAEKAASVQTRTGLWLTAGVLLVLTLAVLAYVTAGMKRMVRDMERINNGETGVRVHMQSGDELESLGRCVNALADDLESMEHRQQELSASYRRFVPERVLSLLDKQDLKDVDKQTVASKTMATMMVWFQFPQPVYEKSGQALFDNLNEIIERTAPIIAKNGGTVFNFAYDGYDAVFEGGAELAISTAVAVRQEILSINNEREMEGRARVDLRIALDEGSILMGLVGDESQMEPIAVSSCFSATKRLIGLCRKMDANILCTEAVASRAADYGVRYMGKCNDGGKVIRTYEIYDGDSYDVRRMKAQTAKQFSEGVYMLYSLDFAGAKRVFMNLVHCNLTDGGAKYYLFLADELEKHQDQEINLDYQL